MSKKRCRFNPFKYLAFLNPNTFSRNANAELYLREQKLKQIERERKEQKKNDNR